MGNKKKRKKSVDTIGEIITNNSVKVNEKFVAAFGNDDVSNKMIENILRFNQITLQFIDPKVEKLFVDHYNLFIRKKVINECYILLLIYCSIFIPKIIISDHDYTILYLALNTVSVILSISIFLAIKLQFAPFLNNIDIGLYFYHFLKGISIIVIQYDSGRKLNTEQLMCYIFIIYGLSGMRFFPATTNVVIITILHIFLQTNAFHRFDFIQNNFISYILIIIVWLSCIYKFRIAEKLVRNGYIRRCYYGRERKRRNILIESMLPNYISKELKSTEKKEKMCREYARVTILFCYVSDFSKLASMLNSVKLVNKINAIYSEFDKITEKKKIYKLEAVEGTYMCAGGVPEKDPLHAQRVVEVAIEMIHTIERLKPYLDGQQMHIQIGISSGPISAGIIGNKTYSYHLFGDTVNTASRMGSSSFPGKIHISPYTYEDIKSSQQFKVKPRGAVSLKGKGSLNTYWVEPGTSSLKEYRNNRITEFFKINPGYKNSRQYESAIFSPENFVSIRKFTLTYDCSSIFHSMKSIQDINLMITNLNQKFIKAEDLKSRGALEINLILIFIYTILNYYFDENENVWYSISLLIYICLMYCIAGKDKWSRFFQHMGVVSYLTFFININSILFFKNRNLYDSTHIPLCMFSTFYIVNIMKIRFYASLIGTIFWLLYYFLFTYTNNHVISTESILYINILTVVQLIISFSREFNSRMDFLQEESLVREANSCIKLLQNMFPSPSHIEAIMNHKCVIDHLKNITLLFADIAGFTSWSAKHSPSEVLHYLDELFSQFDFHLEEYGLYKMDTIGDAYIVAGGLPGFLSESNAGHNALAVVSYASKMMTILKKINEKMSKDLQLRAGIHSGNIIGAIIGTVKPRYLFYGKTAVIANKLESTGLPNQIQISSSTYDFLEEKYHRLFISYKTITLGNESINTYLFQDSMDNQNYLTHQTKKSLHPKSKKIALNRIGTMASQKSILRMVSKSMRDIKRNFQSNKLIKTAKSTVVSPDQGKTIAYKSEDRASISFRRKTGHNVFTPPDKL